MPVIDLPLAHVKSVHPSERLPGWAKPLPNEDTRKYAERLGFAIHQDSLDRSLRGDTAAHAKWREQALKGLGLGQRTEVDITAGQSDEWLRYLTADELQALDTLHKLALQRMSVPPQIEAPKPLRDNPQFETANTVDTSGYASNTKVTEYPLSEPDNTVVHSGEDADHAAD